MYSFFFLNQYSLACCVGHVINMPTKQLLKLYCCIFQLLTKKRWGRQIRTYKVSEKYIRYDLDSTPTTQKNSELLRWWQCKIQNYKVRDWWNTNTYLYINRDSLTWCFCQSGLQIKPAIMSHNTTSLLAWPFHTLIVFKILFTFLI